MPPLSKRERRFLKRQQKEKERLHQMRNEKFKKSLVIFFSILILGGGITFLVIKSPAQSLPSNQGGSPKIEIIPQEYDLGNVSIKDGLIKKTFEIKNIGSGDLKISDIWTSCHCTTAILKVGSKESPKFDMEHSSFWSQNISPGQTAYLEVIFDPAFHGPLGIGSAVRIVYLSTNDSENKQSEILLNVNVTS